MLESKVALEAISEIVADMKARRWWPSPNLVTWWADQVELHTKRIVDANLNLVRSDVRPEGESDIQGH